MTNVFIVPLLALLLALVAFGVVAALVSLRDFIPARFRRPVYAVVVVLLMATATLVSRGDQPEDGRANSLGFSSLFSRSSSRHTNSNTGSRKAKSASGTRNVKPLWGLPPSPMPRSIPAFGRRCASLCERPSRAMSTRL